MIRWYITNDYSSTWYPICSSSHPGHSCRSLSKRPRHLLLSFSLSVPDLLTELLFTLETSSLLTPVQLVLTFLLQLVQFVLSPRAPSICAHFNFLSLFLLSFWHPSFFSLYQTSFCLTLTFISFIFSLRVKKDFYFEPEEHHRAADGRKMITVWFLCCRMI